MIKKPKVVKMTLALPKDVRSWVETKSATDLATMNSTIVRTLRSQMAAEQQRAATVEAVG